MKPRIFVGSSIESLDTAYAVQENLEHDAEVTVWAQGIFDLSRYTIDSLVDCLEETDFGVFVFAPDDVTKMREKEYLTARDNVVFELGLFVGHLGKERCFILLPRDISDLHIPTDLLGMTPGTYEAKRLDGNLVAALGPACNKIRKILHRIGTKSKELKDVALSEEASIEEEFDEVDALMIVEKWLGKQPSADAGQEEMYQFSHVARECNIPRNLVAKVFDEAAQKWDMEVVKKGKGSILLKTLI